MFYRYLPVLAFFVTSLNGREAAVPSLEGDSHYGITYDESLWQPLPAAMGESTLTLRFKKEPIYAQVIYENTPFALRDFHKRVIGHVRAKDRHAQVVSCQIADTSFKMQLNYDWKKKPYFSYGRYESGKLGTVQVVAFGPADRYSAHQGELEALLNGLHPLP
ncbi:MAG: hypothetical protein K0S07_194 [Chlamydiales bacterium]|jgi:hypothetical protein|nr:hypothetical protein [Chlamydiales bacterium]